MTKRREKKKKKRNETHNRRENDTERKVRDLILQVLRIFHTFKVHKHSQVALIVCLCLSVLNCSIALVELLLPLLTLQVIALALLFLSTHMPELFSPIKCKPLSHWPTQARSTKQGEAFTPLLEAAEVSLNAAPEISLQHNCLFSIPLSSKLLRLFREPTYGAVYS